LSWHLKSFGQPTKSSKDLGFSTKSHSANFVSEIWMMP
jgi:hypothetical protein